MKITAVEPIRIGLPYEHDAPKPITTGGAVRNLMEAVYLRVETDIGITGWGEIFAFEGTALMQAAFKLVVEPLVLGSEVDDIAAFMTGLYRRTQGMSLKGPVRNALSGLDIALWDIKGKAEGKPVWQLLGGDGSRKRVRAYASLLRTGAPEHVARLCTSAKGRGFHHIKLHERNDKVVDSVAQARDTVGGDIDLMLDTNCAWLADQVTDMARALLPYGLMWVEEPVYPTDDFATMASVRKETGIPIAAGENLGTVQEFGRMLDAGAVDYIQPEVAKFGGICEMMRAVKVASDKGARLIPHSPIYGPGLMATLHIVAAMKDEPICEHYYADLAESPLGAWSVPSDGYFDIPQGPGLGIAVDEDVIGRYRLSS